MPARTVTNPTAAYGYSGDLTTGLGALTIPFAVGATAITFAPAVVSVNASGFVLPSPTAGLPTLNIGVALETGVQGDVVPVVVLGIVENILADGAIAAGDMVKRSGTTAGRVQVSTGAVAGDTLGIAINAAAGGTVDVWVNAAKAAS